MTDRYRYGLEKQKLKSGGWMTDRYRCDPKTQAELARRWMTDRYRCSPESSNWHENDIANDQSI